MENSLGYFKYYDTDSVIEEFNSGETHALRVTCELPKDGEVIVSKDESRCLYDEVAGLL